MKTHDYQDRFWGHDYVWNPTDNGMKGTILGWGFGISKGDFIILEDKNNGGSRYKFTKIKYFLDPRDMFEGELKFAPRSAKPAATI